MPKPSSYKALHIFNLSKKLVGACYSFTDKFPADEKANLTHYIRSSALKVHLNIAQGAFLKKKKRQAKFIRASQNALVVIDASLEVVAEIGLANEEEATEIMELSSSCYQMLAALQKQK